MSVNSSSGDFLPVNCGTRSLSIFTAFFIVCILLLPLFIFVLVVGYQRWRKQRSVATTSHSDIFTFNMVGLELTVVLGSCFFCYGSYTEQQSLMSVGMFLYSIVCPGHTLFHLLTCVERYLAVVHPITYLRLRQAGGVRIRNISIGCVWLLCLSSVGLSVHSMQSYMAFIFLLLVISSVVVSFCSLSVLCVLIRPGPGEVGGNRERVDHSKHRAFHTIVIITGALLLKFLSSLISIVINTSGLSLSDICVMTWSLVWFSVPSSLVLPLLFLQRAGKLPGCKHDTESG